jgi:hypothetical protein
MHAECPHCACVEKTTLLWIRSATDQLSHANIQSAIARGTRNMDDIGRTIIAQLLKDTGYHSFERDAVEILATLLQARKPIQPSLGSPLAMRSAEPTGSRAAGA